MVGVVRPGFGFITYPGSRIQRSKNHRTHDPDPQHCLSQLLSGEYRYPPGQCFRSGSGS
jgi:hypothetical protein